jgi:hypothetical protein
MTFRKIGDVAGAVRCVFMKQVAEVCETALLHFEVPAHDVLSGMDIVKAWPLSYTDPPYDSEAELRADLNQATDRIVETIFTAQKAREARERPQ